MLYEHSGCTHFLLPWLAGNMNNSTPLPKFLSLPVMDSLPLNWQIYPMPVKLLFIHRHPGIFSRLPVVNTLPYCEVLSFIGIFIMWNYSVLILSHYFCVAWGQEYSFVFLLLGSSWLPTQYLSDDCTCVCNPFILWSWACYLCIPRSRLHTYWQWWVRLRTWRCPSENVSCLP